jgi:hypothetical protein
MSVTALKARTRRRRHEVRVLLDQTILDEHTRLRAEFDQAVRDDTQLNRNPEAPALAEAIAAVEQRLIDERALFVFEQIGRAAWLALIGEHPPRPEDTEQGLDHNPETFPIAALVASCVEVHNPDLDRLDDESARFLAAELNIAEWRKLWNGCLIANLGTADDPKSQEAAVYRRLISRSSNAASLMGSPAASSSDES